MFSIFWFSKAVTNKQRSAFFANYSKVCNMFRELLSRINWEAILRRKVNFYGVEHRRHKGLNNRAENSHQPTRVREKIIRRFKSLGQAQRFLSAFGTINSHFKPRRHFLRAQNYRTEMQSRFAFWREVTNIQPMIWEAYCQVRLYILVQPEKVLLNPS